MKIRENLKWLVVAFKCGDPRPFRALLTRSLSEKSPSFRERLRTGRASRQEFWGFQITYLALTLIVCPLLVAFVGSIVGDMFSGVGCDASTLDTYVLRARLVIILAFWCALFFPLASVMARRLHDIGHSETLAYIIIALGTAEYLLDAFSLNSALKILVSIGFYGSMVFLWVQALKGSVQSGNQYGPCPEEGKMEGQDVVADFISSMFTRIKGKLNRLQAVGTTVEAADSNASALGESQPMRPQEIASQDDSRTTNEVMKKLFAGDRVELVLLLIPLGAILISWGLFVWAGATAGFWSLILFSFSAGVARWGVAKAVRKVCKLFSIALEEKLYPGIAYAIVGIPILFWGWGCFDAGMEIVKQKGDKSLSECRVNPMAVYVTGLEKNFISRSGYYFVYKFLFEVGDQFKELDKLRKNVRAGGVDVETQRAMSNAVSDGDIILNIQSALMEENYEEANKLVEQIHDKSMQRYQRNIVRQQMRAKLGF